MTHEVSQRTGEYLAECRKEGKQPRNFNKDVIIMTEGKAIHFYEYA